MSRYARNAFGDIFIILAFLIATAEFFSPVIISALSGNWWFMFLFFVSWIPALATIVMAGILIE